MKIRLFLLSLVTVFVVSTRSQALEGQAITKPGHFYGDRGYSLLNDSSDRPVRAYSAYTGARPAIYVKPVNGEEAVFLDTYTGWDPQSRESGEYYHPWKAVNQNR